MHKETIAYTAGKATCKGYLVYNPNLKGLRPVVIIAHAWRVQDEFARQKATELAELGYIAFAADLYGDGKPAYTNDEALQLMFRRRIN